MCDINLIPTADVNLMSIVDITKHCHFCPMIDGQLASIVDIILMSIQLFLPTEDTSGKMSALYIVLIIYFCPSLRA